jgi:hypothetical protein
VTVAALTLTADLQLSPSVANGPFDRCVTFEVWDCDAAGGPLRASVERTLSFRNGLASGVTVNLPGGTWDCITARDRRHTLRSASSNFATSDNVSYTASFVGSRATGGHWLVGGNLNDDSFIDIVDFALFFPRYLSQASPNSPCGATGTDANLNGDNVVDLLDLVFISGNSLLMAEPNCCGLGAVAGENPVWSATIHELRARGVDDPEASDLDHNGVVDLRDLKLFLGGDLPPWLNEVNAAPRPYKMGRPPRSSRR